MFYYLGIHICACSVKMKIWMEPFDNKFRKVNNSVSRERDSILEDIQGFSTVLVILHFTSINGIIFMLFCLKYLIINLKYEWHECNGPSEPINNSRFISKKPYSDFKFIKQLQLHVNLLAKTMGCQINLYIWST